MLNPSIDNEMMNAFNSNAALVYQSQAASIKEIAASIEELTTSSKVLEEMAQET